jgi:hypothetical protein
MFPVIFFESVIFFDSRLSKRFATPALVVKGNPAVFVVLGDPEVVLLNISNFYALLFSKYVPM